MKLSLIVPLVQPITAILFDCDGTLSMIEGIDELAKLNGVGDIVQDLTANAMGNTGMTLDIYAKRLTLVRPTQKQLEQLGIHYIANLAPHIKTVIHILQRFNKSIYIISAGLFPAVKVLGDALNIPEHRIFAVNIAFDKEGQYQHFDSHSPMTQKNGKREIVSHLKKQHPELAFVGDGLSDLEVYDLVTRFVGYGGAYYRKNIEAACEYYIKSTSMGSLLPLLLTQSEQSHLTDEERKLFS